MEVFFFRSDFCLLLITLTWHGAQDASSKPKVQKTVSVFKKKQKVKSQLVMKVPEKPSKDIHCPGS